MQDFFFLDVLVYTLYLGIYGFLIIIFLIKLFKVDEVARPFILSLVIFFLCLTVGSIIMYFDNKTTLWGTITSSADSGLLDTFSNLSLALLAIGALYLIFNLEKNAFQNSLIKEKHVVTIIQIILILLFFIQLFFSSDTSSGGLIGLYFLILIIQVIFFTGGFLYIGIKSTGYVKRLSILVALSYLSIILSNGANFWLGNQLRLGNFSSSLEDFMLSMGILFALRSFFTVIMSYGLLKLYGKKF